MLNYWRTTGATGGGGTAAFFTGKSTSTSRPTANNFLFTAASPFSDYGFDGPFFDLEFALSDHNDGDGASETSESETASDEDMREIELNFDVDGPDLKISPTALNNPEENSKLSGSLVKSAAKFRVLMLKLKKSDPSSGVLDKGVDKSEKTEGVRVKFRVDEVKGPLISLFARDYSISEDSRTNPAYLGKEMMQKYLNVLKPLYVGVEKKKSGQVRAVSPAPEMRNNNQLQARLKLVRKHFGKSRSTSAAAMAVSPPAKVGSSRHDDSLLEVQDGIQGAILHCKRSFNSTSNSNKEGELCMSIGE